MRNPSTASAAGLASTLPSGTACSRALAAAIAASAPSKPAAHPDAALLQLVAAFLAAEEKRAEIYANADAAFARYVAPPIPPALMYQPERDTWEICRDLQSIENVRVDGVIHRFYGSDRDLPVLCWKIGAWRKHGTGGDLVARAEEIVAALGVYMPAVERAQDEAGITLFNQQATAVEAEKDALLRQIAVVRATTTEGLRAKAQVVFDDMAEAWLVDTHIPELLASKSDSTYSAAVIAVVLSMVVDAGRIGASAPSATA